MRESNRIEYQASIDAAIHHSSQYWVIASIFTIAFVSSLKLTIDLPPGWFALAVSIGATGTAYAIVMMLERWYWVASLHYSRAQQIERESGVFVHGVVFALDHPAHALPPYKRLSEAVEATRRDVGVSPKWWVLGWRPRVVSHSILQFIIGMAGFLWAARAVAAVIEVACPMFHLSAWLGFGT